MMEKYGYDMNTIIKLVYAQYPCQQRSDVVRALKDCKESWWVSDNYLSFYHPLKHEESFFKERLSLKVGKGSIHIDILRNGKIEGIEFDLIKNESTNSK